MLRFVASTLGSLRPALLRNVRSNNALALPDRDIKRKYSTVHVPRTDYRSEFPYSKPGVFPSNDASLPKESQEIITADRKKFVDLVTSLTGDYHKKYSVSDTVGTLYELFKLDEVSSRLSNDDVLKYATLLGNSTYRNRVQRLSESLNRDSDQYENKTLHNDVLLKNAIMNLADFVSDSRHYSVVQNDTIRKLLLAMSQYGLLPEMLKLWEHGVNDAKSSRLYLQQNVLSVVLPVAYDEKRFTYDQIARLYEVNCSKTNFRYHELLTSMGKIAIKEGDYKRALDSLEQLLESFAAYPERKLLQKSLAELHLSFIGRCKDVKIAKNFYDKVIHKQLPYDVILKAPHVASLLQNCYDANEPFDMVKNFWKTTVNFYNKTASTNAISNANARYSIINKKFFTLFFEKYPALTQESYSALKEVISIYANTKKVDELFLNNVISNYSWGDKTVFEQLVENYTVHKVEQSQVTRRVTLKKLGDIPGIEASEIIQYWNASLASLDKLRFNYIPIADWAALRDATITSRYGDEREGVYLALLSAYKNFHQDGRAVDRFVRLWVPTGKKEVVARVALEDEENFDHFEIEKPQFENLREHVNYKQVAQNYMRVRPVKI